MMQKNNANVMMQKTLFKKQRGATLFTALVFLALMTIVSVSAAKISMLDVLVSGNNQQQMVLFQKTARELDDHSRGQKLLTLFEDVEATAIPYTEWTYNYPDDVLKPHTDERITNRNVEYQCEGQGGLATSQGSDTKCHLFDFEVRTSKAYSSARDRHVRGSGKIYPAGCRNNYNNC